MPGTRTRVVKWALLILIVVGVVGGYQFYQMRKVAKAAGDSYLKQAEMLKKLRGG
jgi:uncharacterized membrane-anchored protein